MGFSNSCQKRSLFHHDLLFLLVSARVPGLVSLLLSSFFSRKGVLFHYDVLVPLGSGSGFGACFPFFSLLSFLRKGVLFHHDVLALHGSGSGAGACLFFFSLLSFLRKWSLFHNGPGSSWFRLGFRCLSPFCFLLAGSGVLSWLFRSAFVVFPGSGWGSGASLPPSLFFLFQERCFVSS